MWQPGGASQQSVGERFAASTPASSAAALRPSALSLQHCTTTSQKSAQYPLVSYTSPCVPLWRGMHVFMHCLHAYITSFCVDDDSSADWQIVMHIRKISGMNAHVCCRLRSASWASRAAGAQQACSAVLLPAAACILRRASSSCRVRAPTVRCDAVNLKRRSSSACMHASWISIACTDGYTWSRGDGQKDRAGHSDQIVCPESMQVCTSVDCSVRSGARRMRGNKQWGTSSSARSASSAALL